jgi:hypothetical protein
VAVIVAIAVSVIAAVGQDAAGVAAPAVMLLLLPLSLFLLL